MDEHGVKASDRSKTRPNNKQVERNTPHERRRRHSCAIGCPYALFRPPLADPILKAVEKAGYETPSPIQEKAIPPLLEGSDLLGVAQTGTGKTAAFSLPLLSRIDESVKAPRFSALLRPGNSLCK